MRARRDVWFAIVTSVACSSAMDTASARRVQGTVTFTNVNASAAAPAPPYVSVLDSIELRVTPASGPVVTLGRRLTRHEVQASFPLNLPTGSATFSAQVLSTNRSVLFTGSTPVNVNAEGFQVTLQLAAQRPVLVVAADTSRTSGPSTTTFQVYNGGSLPLAWSIPTRDPVFATCTACTITPNAGTLAPQQTATVSLSVPIVFATRNMSFVFRSSEGDVTPVWSYAIATITGVTVSPNPALVSVQSTTPFTVAVQSTGSTAVTWSSQNAAIASVNAAGQATGVASGTATIVAASQVNPAVTGTALLRVYTPPPIQALPNWDVTIPAGSDTVSRDGPTGKLTIALRAQLATSTTITVPPYSPVEFWARPTQSGLPWRRIATSSTPAFLDQGRTRFWHWNVNWNPDANDAPYGNGIGRMDLVATGILSNGSVSASIPNPNLWLRIP